MASVSLQGPKYFGAAPSGGSFDGAAELVVILGASGCGKTTTLRMIAGSSSERRPHLIGGEDVTRCRRGCNIGMVFQNYALFPT
jgi:putative spermidine/putrescine transport system ATP-binding protein